MSRITKDLVGFFPTDIQQKGLFRTQGWRNLPGWLPLLILPCIAWIFRNSIAPWIFMWAMAFALYFGCKWLTWWRCAVPGVPLWRHLAYLFAWLGMDANAFLDPRKSVSKPQLREWIAAILKTVFGALLVWWIVKLIGQPLLAGWIGLVGCIFLLHFGTFHLLALLWQQLGIDAQPIMRAPILAKSLADFWGTRWNSAFNLLVHKLVFRKIYRHIGATGATLAVFLVSGIIHDLLISVPARAGYGLPTIYFLLQGVGLCFERRKLNQAPLFHHQIARRSFTIAVTAIPAFWLFHPPFIRNVILPMLHAIGAT